MNFADTVSINYRYRHRPVGRYDHSRYNSPTILPLRGAVMEVQSGWIAGSVTQHPFHRAPNLSGLYRLADFRVFLPTIQIGGSGEQRSHNFPVKSRILCQLSYEPMKLTECQPTNYQARSIFLLAPRFPLGPVHQRLTIPEGLSIFPV